MSESLKYIERVKSEQVTDEINSLTYSSAKLDNLVTEAWSKLYAEATGTDVIHPNSQYTNNIVELKPVFLSFLWNLFKTPIKLFNNHSLSQMFSGVKSAYDWLFGRLNKDYLPTPTLTTPLTAENLPANLQLLNTRKIECGDVLDENDEPEIPDGMSLARLLCFERTNVTEIIDNNIYGVDSEVSQLPIFTIFPNIKKLQLGCKNIKRKQLANNASLILNNSIIQEVDFPNCEEIVNFDGGIVALCPNLSNASFPKLKTLYSGYGGNHNKDGILVECDAIIKMELPSLEKFENRQFSGGNNCIMYNDSGLQELIMPKLSNIISSALWSQHQYFCVGSCPAIRKIVTGTLKAMDIHFVDSNSNNLIHLEIGEGTAVSMLLSLWTPTTAISTSDATLVEENMPQAIDNNMKQFLYNFRKCFMLKLKDVTLDSQLTLTLSPTVYQVVYGVDSNYSADASAPARTLSLGDIGLTSDDLTAKETGAGITTSTKYYSWLDTYRGVINWNIGHS